MRRGRHSTLPILANEANMATNHICWTRTVFINHLLLQFTPNIRAVFNCDEMRTTKKTFFIPKALSLLQMEQRYLIWRKRINVPPLFWLTFWNWRTIGDAFREVSEDQIESFFSIQTLMRYFHLHYFFGQHWPVFNHYSSWVFDFKSWQSYRCDKIRSPSQLL